ncbi:hypothetical protein ANN_18753 [Periplaneta americana]|uniref:Reverse transcriptase domain-containing protein n=1 Tax=Periplaneta americana TaxID=6978 RepID=A0ABQ8SQX9_PERAM|nr:hypothetical protein ANN_18753 [Periplaneta americana]
MSSKSNAESYPAILLQVVEGKPRKNSNQVTCPKQDLNPGPLVSRSDVLTVTSQRKVQDNRYGLELNGLQPLVYADDVNMLEENPQTIRENTGILLQASKAKGLEVNPENGGLTVYENKVIRKIFGTKRDEITGEWRKLRDTELHALYSSPDIIRNIKSKSLRWAGLAARMGECRNAYRVLVERPEKKDLWEGRRWEDNIKMNLREKYAGAATAVNSYCGPAAERLTCPVTTFPCREGERARLYDTQCSELRTTALKISKTLFRIITNLNKRCITSDDKTTFVYSAVPNEPRPAVVGQLSLAAIFPTNITGDTE